MACGDDFHRHRHAEDDDGLGSCDDGSEEEQKHEDEEGWDRQCGEELRQCGDDTGLRQDFLEDHDQQCAEEELCFKCGPNKRNQLPTVKVIDEDVNQNTDPHSPPHRKIKGQNQENGKCDSPDALCEEHPVVALRLIRHHAGILRYATEVKEPADCKQRCHHREHRKDERACTDTAFCDAEGDKDARVGRHECLRDVTEIRGDASLLRNAEVRVLHAFADDRTADQHGTCGRQHAEQKWHDRSIDPIVIKESVHRDLGVAQIFPFLHHTL